MPFAYFFNQLFFFLLNCRNLDFKLLLDFLLFHGLPFQSLGPLCTQVFNFELTQNQQFYFCYLCFGHVQESMPKSTPDPSPSVAAAFQALGLGHWVILSHTQGLSHSCCGLPLPSTTADLHHVTRHLAASEGLSLAVSSSLLLHLRHVVLTATL